MFIRVKKIKGQKYAYLVENKWPEEHKQTDCNTAVSSEKPIKKQPKQTVIGYLGRVYEFEMPKTIFSSKLTSNFKESITELIKWHLKEHGFKERKNYMTGKGLVYNIDKRELKSRKTKKEAVIKSFDGYICNTTLKELYELDGRGYDEEVGKRLAKTLVKAGLNVPKEVFVQLFEKVFKEER